jgi:hypothetical protein
MTSPIALALHSSGNLYAGGWFLSAGNTVSGDVPAKYIAKWNGTAWSAAPEIAVSGDVNAIAYKNSTLYVAGSEVLKQTNTAVAPAAERFAVASNPTSGNVFLLSRSSGASTADFRLLSGSTWSAGSTLTGTGSANLGIMCS